jgi:hypothetical protein
MKVQTTVCEICRREDCGGRIFIIPARTPTLDNDRPIRICENHPDLDLKTNAPWAWYRNQDMEDAIEVDEEKED